MKHQRRCSKRLPECLQHNVPKKVELDLDCLCFEEFGKPNYKIRNSQVTYKTANAQFRGEFLPLQLKCALVGGQDRAYSFRNTRNHKDAVQLLHLFVHWNVCFKETFHRRFAMLALNVHGLRHRSKSYRFYPGWSHL
jgi:hypothetical protein